MVGVAVVLAGVAAFFASRAITASLSGDGAENDCPEINAFAISPVPPPPAWPQPEQATDEEKGGRDTSGDASPAGTGSVEEETEPAAEEVPPNSTQPAPQPPRPPPEGDGSGNSGGGSGGGWVTGGQVGG